MGRLINEPAVAELAATDNLRIQVAEAVAAGDLCVHFSGRGFFPWTEDYSPFANTEYPNTLRGSQVAVDSAAAGDITVASLKSGHIVVAWNAGGVLKLSLYYSNGALGLGPVTTAITASAISLAALPDGNFVAAYLGASGYPCFQRYDAVLNAVGAPVQIEAFSATSIAVAALTSGEFIVTYAKTADTTQRFGRYSAAGVLQGALTYVGVTGSTTRCGICALTGGGFVVVFSSLGNVPNFARYSNAGALQGAVTVVEGSALAEIKVCSLSSGGFAIAHAITGQVRNTVYDANGAVVSATRTVASDTVTKICMARSPDRGYALCYITGTGSFMRVLRYDNASVPLGAAFDVGTASGGVIAADKIVDGGMIYAFSDGSSYPKFGRYSSLPCSVIGVVLTGAAADGIAEIGTRGLLATTRYFRQSTGFNHQVQSSPGNRGFLLGYTALLEGIKWAG